MTSLPDDIISIIAEFFINKEVSTYTIHKFLFMNSRIGKIFGKKYIEYLQKKHKVFNIYDIVAKELHKSSILHYPIIKEIKDQIEKLQQKKIFFENLSAKERHIVYLFAIYYEYIWFQTLIEYCLKRLYYGKRYHGGGFYIYELWDENNHDFKELKRKGLYSEELFDRNGDICRWKSHEELDKINSCDFSIMRPLYIYKIKKLKLIKL